MGGRGVCVGAILQRDYYKRTCFDSAVDVLPMLERRTVNSATV